MYAYIIKTYNVDLNIRDTPSVSSVLWLSETFHAQSFYQWFEMVLPWAPAVHSGDSTVAVSR